MNSIIALWKHPKCDFDKLMIQGQSGTGFNQIIDIYEFKPKMSGNKNFKNAHVKK
jgi:hypothetical protein